MDEPNYNITDSSGTVVGQIGVTSGGDPIVSKPGGGSVIVTDDGVEIPGDADVGGSLSTGEAIITNQTSIKVQKDTNQNFTRDDRRAVTWESVSEDNLGEFDLSTNEFTPDQDGEFLVIVQIRLSGGSSGDVLTLDLGTGGDNKKARSTRAKAGKPTNIRLVDKVELSAGTAYTAGIVNFTSDDTIQANGEENFLKIWRIPE